MTVQDSILRSCKTFKTAEDLFKQKLWEMVISKPNKKGIRLQKTEFLVRKNVMTFTVTIQRGDNLNK